MAMVPFVEPASYSGFFNPNGETTTVDEAALYSRQ